MERPTNPLIATLSGSGTQLFAHMATHPLLSGAALLHLLPEPMSIYLWSDLDFGGFNILSQLRRTVNGQIQPFLMDIETLESNIPRARPLTASDRTNLKRLLLRPGLGDVRSIIEHLLKRGLKLEQEGVENF